MKSTNYTLNRPHMFLLLLCLILAVDVDELKEHIFKNVKVVYNL